MKAPERLFATDPDLVRLHDVLEQDEPPYGARDRMTERVLARAAAERAPRPRPRPSARPSSAVSTCA